ncbi:uncharacterized protein [Mytilus edulis]|uniref:uncharacterized protein n=1 Tax=Mytilus edulis TaxID=6550 RepID=UPI0039EFA7ED
MDILILLTVLQMFSLIGAYEFTCPSQAHWNLRAKSMCKTTTNYTCLFDINLQVNVYRDKCYRPRILGPGYKYVFQPNLNRAACSDNRYQPFNFETIGYSDCTYQKSLCNSLGQETYKTGDTSIDRKCVCNIEGGYTFVRNSKDQCFCNPSTEDCSCYVGINNYNTTIGQEDMKCYDDMKMTSLRNSDDRLNISRTNKITDFDNYKYNLNYVPTNEYRIEAAKWVLLLLSAYLVVWILIEVIFRRWTKNRNRDINKLNKHVQSSETEKRYFVRIMIVGKGQAGKTCLLRRLLKEDISNVTSTDGVDINVHRCKINIKDGTWTIGKDVGDDKKDRIKRALMSDGNIKIETTEDTADRKNMYIKSRQSLNGESNTLANKSIKVNKDFPIDMTPADSIEARDTKNMQVDETKYKHLSNFDELSTNKKDSTTDTKVCQDKNESLTLVMPENLMSHVFSKLTGITPSNHYALCELWDFAGQKEFYATHQAFLTSSAVYLVVADMQDDIHKQGLNQFSSDFQHIGEYVDFWFDSIHCHRTSDTERVKDGHFDPPILLVFTGKDKYNEADFEKRKKELNDQIDQVLGYQSKYHHLHDEFFLSNKEDTDEEFEKLRYAIFKTVGTMDNWGKAFPLKWILLEHLIEINKKKGKNFINFNDMSNLAKHPQINILKKEDLLLFLRFQHNVGNIIFFENIRDLIILKPQWLADAFRCLVSDKFNKSRLHHRNDWTLFTRKGTISESLITELFELKNGSQFSGQNNNLHKVMEELDILVKIENSNYYIMPSMMPSSTFDDVCKQLGIIDGKCKRTSWLCFKFEFLPPSFFNHLSAWFIRNYDPSKEDCGISLNRGICMFDIDASGGTKILVTMSTDTIALQVVTFSKQNAGFGSTCSNIYSEISQLLEDIKKRYSVNISFKLHFKCSNGYYFKETFEYEKLTSLKELFCNQHQQMHQSEQMYSLWMKKEVCCTIK